MVHHLVNYIKSFQDVKDIQLMAAGVLRVLATCESTVESELSFIVAALSTFGFQNAIRSAGGIGPIVALLASDNSGGFLKQHILIFQQ
jgi:hypothetical protein